MKKVTSITMHTTAEGQRLSYTYSVIDETTGTITADNIRESMIVLDIELNRDVLQSINHIKEFVQSKIESV